MDKRGDGGGGRVFLLNPGIAFMHKHDLKQEMQLKVKRATKAALSR